MGRKKIKEVVRVRVRVGVRGRGGVKGLGERFWGTRLG